LYTSNVIGSGLRKKGIHLTIQAYPQFRTYRRQPLSAITLLQKAALDEADVSLGADDHMVQDPYR
jgi:hypothetical protein